MTNSQEVNFIPSSQDVEFMTPRPQSAKNYLPKWFKDMPTLQPTLRGNRDDGTAKKCPPFLDALTSGYTQELICDVEIINLGVDPNTGNDIVNYKWAGPIKPLSTRAQDTDSRRVFPNFDGYYTNEFHWITQWEPQTPAGYSTLYFHPANRLDLPFLTMNGIIDTDKWSVNGPIPFMVKKGFEGLIPAGTPIYQMIFIKREDWTSQELEYNDKQFKKMSYGIKKVMENGYKKNFWSKKNYS
jgi:hypothetical protein